MALVVAEIGMTVSINGIKNIIVANNGSYLLTATEKPFRIQIHDTSRFSRHVISGEYKYEGNLPQLDASRLNDDKREKAYALAADFRELLNDCFPNWDLLFRQKVSKPGFRVLAQKYSCTEDYIRRLLKRFILAGCDEIALADQRAVTYHHTHWGFSEKYARGSKKDMDIIEKSIQRSFLNGIKVFKATKCAQDAFDSLLENRYLGKLVTDQYGQTKLYPTELCPSPRTYLRFLLNSTGCRSVKDFREKYAKKGSDNRPHTGCAHTDVTRIGQLSELDECELPIYIGFEVFEDGEIKFKIIGKAIVYVATDVYSGIIHGAYVGLDNNSRNGFCSLFVNMVESHTEQLAEIGLHNADELYPGGYLPEAIRVDHGSEYESYCVAHVTRELRIDTSFVPAATGSLKGLVEKMHDNVQGQLRKVLFDSGVILPDKYKGVDFAKEHVICTLEELRRFVLRCVVIANQGNSESRQPSKHQIQINTPMSPVSLFNYAKKYISDVFRPVTASNRERTAFALSYHDKTCNRKLWAVKNKDKDKEDAVRVSIKTRNFRLTNAGIIYSGSNAHWILDEPWFENLMRNSDKEKDNIEIRYNEFSVGFVYIRFEGKYHRIPLASKIPENQDFINMSFDEFDAYEELRKETAREQKRETAALRAGNAYLMRKEVKQIKELSDDNVVVTTDIKDSRREYKEHLSKDPREPINRMYEAFGDDTAVPTDDTAFDTDYVGAGEPELHNEEYTPEQLATWLDDREARNTAMEIAQKKLADYRKLPADERYCSDEEYLYTQYDIACDEFCVSPEEPSYVTKALLSNTQTSGSTDKGGT